MSDVFEDEISAPADRMFGPGHVHRDRVYAAQAAAAGGYPKGVLPPKAPLVRPLSAPAPAPAPAQAEARAAIAVAPAPLAGGLRRIAALPNTSALKRSPLAPPPRIAWLPLTQLVVAAEYQRSLSNNSVRLIRRMVQRWDWTCFKPLSVAPTHDGLYEVVDGQHTAIAAATHGAIETLPCLVLDAPTTASRAGAFLGINRDRIKLTPIALYRASLAANEPAAVAVHAALARAGLEAADTGGGAAPDTITCVATLVRIVKRHDAERLSRVLELAKRAGLERPPSALLSALAGILDGGGGAAKSNLSPPCARSPAMASRPPGAAGSWAASSRRPTRSSSASRRGLMADVHPSDDGTPCASSIEVDRCEHGTIWLKLRDDLGAVIAAAGLTPAAAVALADKARQLATDAQLVAPIADRVH